MSSPNGVRTPNLVENWIYYFDAFVGLALAGAVAGRWRRLRQRAAEGRGKRPGAGVAIRLVLAAFLLLHVWAQFRPVPVLVETRRLMTDAEKAHVVNVVKSGFTMEMLRDMQMAGTKPFNGSNASGWSWTEVYKLKCLLAWTAFLPRLPKEILIRECGIPREFLSGEATYNYVGSRHKVISFTKNNDQWAMPRTYFQPACLAAPSTNYWDPVISYVRVVLRIY